MAQTWFDSTANAGKVASACWQFIIIVLSLNVIENTHFDLQQQRTRFNFVDVKVATKAASVVRISLVKSQ